MVNAILGSGHDFTQRLNRIEQQLRDLSTQAILLHASTGQSGGQGLSTDINGLHLFNPAGAEVVTLATADGSATLGNTTITGNLAVPNGSISNAALVSPVVFGSNAGSVTNMSISTTSTALKTVTLTTPPGYTQAQITSQAVAMAVNGSAGSDYLYVQAVINGVNGGEVYSSSTAVGTGNSVTNPYYATLYGLTSGASINVSVAVRTSAAAWPANSANMASIYVQATFLR